MPRCELDSIPGISGYCGLVANVEVKSLPHCQPRWRLDPPIWIRQSAQSYRYANWLAVGFLSYARYLFIAFCLLQLRRWSRIPELKSMGKILFTNFNFLNMFKFGIG